MSEIKIIVERFRAGDSESNNRIPRAAKGIIKRKPEDDYLFRRANPKTGIRFFDVGQIKNELGNWTTKPFALAKNVHINAAEGNSNPSFWGFGVEPMTQSEVDAETYTDIFDATLDKPDAFFREVKKSNSNVFPILIDGADLYLDNRATSDKWTDDGLKLSDGDAGGITRIYQPGTDDFRPRSQFLDIDLTTVKITTDFDRTSGAVSDFKLAGKADIFLAPAITVSFGLSQKFYSTGSYTRKVALNYIYRFEPRYFDDPSAHTNGSYGDDTATRMKTETPTRQFYYDIYTTSPNLRDVLKLSDTDIFPQPADHDYLAQHSHAYFFFENLKFLLAVIRQKGNFYYVWTA